MSLERDAPGRGMVGGGRLQGAEMSRILIVVELMKGCSFGKILYAVNLRSVHFFLWLVYFNERI